jgi:hypothetical protein
VPRRQAGLYHFIILYSLWEGSRRQVIDALKASNLEADIQIDVPRLVSFYDRPCLGATAHAASPFVGSDILM